MSTEKLSPRQQMIGLMYLVLLAMLAMNASKDLLNAFILLDNGINLTNENLEAEKKETKSTKSNSELMAEFFSINSDVDKK